jgi:hypothetical protein
VAENVKLSIYPVMLEGAVDRHGFYMTIDVLADSSVTAKALALEKAAEMELGAVEVRQVKVRAYVGDTIVPAVIKVYGKSFFEREC